jgi:hypothetical protein
MKSIVQGIIACIAIIGLTSSAVAASNNAGGAGDQQGQQGNGQGARKVCHADVKKFCQGVKPGEGRIIACLKANSSGLSPECAARVAKAPNRQAQGQGQGQDEDDGEK